jgi:hypothetical protein
MAGSHWSWDGNLLASKAMKTFGRDQGDIRQTLRRGPWLQMGGAETSFDRILPAPSAWLRRA